MKNRIINWLDDLRFALFSSLFLSLGLIITGIMYGIYNVPGYQDANNILVLAEDIKNSVPSMFILAGMLMTLQPLLDFVIRSVKRDKQQELITELNETVKTLVEQNKILLKKVEAGFIESGANNSNDTIIV